MMKRKHRLGKGISLLLAISLLLGVTVVGTFAEDSGAGDAVAQSETTAFPWDGYTRITMEDYGIDASLDEKGTLYTGNKAGQYKGESLNKTYLDVDINFEGNYHKSGADYYIRYFLPSTSDWTKDVRIKPIDTHLIISDSGNPKRDTVQSGDIWKTLSSMGVSLDEFFNLKILVDIVASEENAEKNEVRLQFYINGNKAGELAWSEATSETHGAFQFYCPSGSFSLRTPKPWTDYTRITMENYNIAASEGKEGTYYEANTSGTYTGTSLHKTYLDMDINFEGNYHQSSSNYYIRFFGISNSDWSKDIWIQPTNTHLVIDDRAGRSGDIWKTISSVGISLDKFFNLKILIDIVPNDKGGNDVRLQFYVEESKVGDMAWTEEEGQIHSNLQFYCSGNAFSLRTPLLPETIDYGYDIATYRTEVNGDEAYTSYPEKTGYVFGGWYSDVYLTEPLDFSVTTGYAYAKFVPEDVLTVKFQKLVNASKEDETTKLRTITSVDSLEYEYVGFKRVVDGDANTEKVYTTKSVFKTIKGMVNGETYTYTPSAISADAEYLMALSINKIPQSVYESTITITPLWKTLDGTIVTGQARDTQLFETEVEGGTTLYGGEDFANDNEAYYQNRWIY